MNDQRLPTLSAGGAPPTLEQPTGVRAKDSAGSSIPLAKPRQLYVRHALAVRIMHWINVVALTLMFMSGLQIFNAHPALYWGTSSYTGRPAWLEIGAKPGAQGDAVGYTRVLGHEFTTTGV